MYSFVYLYKCSNACLDMMDRHLALGVLVFFIIQKYTERFCLSFAYSAYGDVYEGDYENNKLHVYWNIQLF